jgi:outer membrane protein TolC
VSSRPFLTLLVLLVLGGPLYGQEASEPSLPKPLTLVAAVERALATWPGTAAARARREEAAAARRLRGRFTGAATQFQEPMPITPIHGFGPGLFPEFDDTLFQGTLTVSYVLYDGGATGARLRTAEAQAGAAGAALGAAEQALTQRVAAAYLTAVSKSRVLAAHDLRLRALQAEVARAGQRFEAGKAARVEVLRADAVLAGAEAERVVLAAAVSDAERELARLLAVPEVRAADLAAVALAEPALPPREEVAAAAVAASPAVEQARRAVAAAEAGIKLAESALRPELRAVGNVNEWAALEGSDATEWNAGFQVAVPLFDGGATRRRIARAEAARQAAGEEFRLAELNVRAEVDRTATAVEEARARAASLERALAGLTEVARIQKLLLDTGAGTQTDYLDAEADLLAARAGLAEVQNAAILARTELARAAGGLDLVWLRTWLRQNLESTP